MTLPSCITKWWSGYTAQESDLFARFVTTFERARSGALSRDALHAETGSYWLAGYVSPVYFLGAELFGAIYHASGKDGAFEAMHDPRKLLPMYDAALRSRHDILSSCYALPDSTLRHAGALDAGR